eukprot:scaffold38273_cov28-Tisochrysis_lutea.AAC.1
MNESHKPVTAVASKLARWATSAIDTTIYKHHVSSRHPAYNTRKACCASIAFTPNIAGCAAISSAASQSSTLSAHPLGRSSYLSAMNSLALRAASQSMSTSTGDRAGWAERGRRNLNLERDNLRPPTHTPDELCDGTLLVYAMLVPQRRAVATHGRGSAHENAGVSADRPLEERRICGRVTTAFVSRSFPKLRRKLSSRPPPVATASMIS